MRIEGLLPVGSVVLLQQGKHRVMIIGYCQKLISQPEQVYDYVGCLFPEGYINAEQNYLFNREQIAKFTMSDIRPMGSLPLYRKWRMPL